MFGGTDCSNYDSYCTSVSLIYLVSSFSSQGRFLDVFLALLQPSWTRIDIFADLDIANLLYVTLREAIGLL